MDEKKQTKLCCNHVINNHCTMHFPIIFMLNCFLFLRADSTYKLSSVNIRWTFQRTTPCFYEEERFCIHIRAASMYSVGMVIYAVECASSWSLNSSGHEISLVLQLPSPITRFSCYKNTEWRLENKEKQLSFIA